MQVIIIEGGIGVGKSTLLNSLKRINPEQIGIVPEIVPEQKLKLFLEGNLDALGFQLIMASKRLVAQHQALELEKTRKYVFMERSIFSDHCFAQCAIKYLRDILDYEIFARGYLWSKAVVPDLTIYLRGSFEGQTQRIKERGRDGEAWYLTEEGIKYRQGLNLQHDVRFFHKPNTLTLNPDELDWRNDTVARTIFETIQQELNERVKAS